MNSVPKVQHHLVRQRATILSLTVAVATSLLAANFAGAQHFGLVGKWVGPVDAGTQETLVLFGNGAYKSVTTLVDPAAFRSYHAKLICEGSRRSKGKVRCDDKIIDKQVAAIAKFFPSTFIGTYAIQAAQIEFTHGCAENVDGCQIGKTTDNGVYFLEADALTIKMDGIRVKGKVMGGGTTTYARHP